MGFDPTTWGFSDLSSVPYTGLTDTATDFTGSTTLQDVQLGSPIVLDTSSQVVPDAAVTDLLPQVPTVSGSWAPTAAEMSQMLAGTSDVPPSATAAAAQTTTPNSTDSSAASWAALGALSKFGSSLAGLFGNTMQVKQAAPTRSTTPYTGASLMGTGAYNSGPFTLITVVVIGALILLMLRD